MVQNYYFKPYFNLLELMTQDIDKRFNILKVSYVSPRWGQANKANKLSYPAIYSSGHPAALCAKIHRRQPFKWAYAPLHWSYKWLVMFMKFPIPRLTLTC